MADIITITFSLVSLVCGIISSFWILKLREYFTSEEQTTYVLSALIATSFLISFPLWTLFNEFFPYSITIKRISYLLFSIGYFGVLVISYLSVENVETMTDKIDNMHASLEKLTKVPRVKKETLKAKIMNLKKATHELDKYKKFSMDVGGRMKELQQEIDSLQKQP